MGGKRGPAGKEHNMEENTNKKYFRVAITETLRRTVTVEAESEEEAHQKVSDRWHNNEYVLAAEDFDGVEFYVTGEGTAEEAEKDKAARGWSDSLAKEADGDA